MGVFGMGLQKNIFLKSEQGQSTVEYILLFAVVISLISLVFKSESFKNLFGEQGEFATIYKSEIEFSYRNALPGREAFAVPNYQEPNAQPSYQGRFFIALDQYPSQ